MNQIRVLAQADPAVKAVLRVLTLYFGLHEVLLNLEVQFYPQISAEEVTLAVARLEAAIRSQHIDIKNIFIEAKSISGRSERTRAN